MSSESEESEVRHWHGRRCRHRYRQSEDEGSDASSPREELVADAAPSHEETDTPPKVTGSLRVGKQEPSGPDCGDHDGVLT